MVTHLYQPLTELEGVDDHKFVVEIKRNFEIMGFDILVSVKKDVMGILVISKFLLLLSNIDSNFNSLFDVSNGSVELECPLRLLRDIVCLSHEVVHQFMSK